MNEKTLENKYQSPYSSKLNRPKTAGKKKIPIKSKAEVIHNIEINKNQMKNAIKSRIEGQY